MYRVILSYVFLFGAPVMAMAQQSPGTQLPDAWRKGDVAPTGHFSFSLEYDRIFLRDLDEKRLSGAEFDDLGVFDGALSSRTTNVELESDFVYLRSAYSMYAPEDSPFGIEGYFLLGGANIKLEGRVKDPGDPSDSFDVEGDFDFAVGGGFRSRLYAIDQWNFLADFSIRWSKHESSIKKVDNLDLDLGPGEGARQDFETELFSWQLSLYASYSLEVNNVRVVPYGGLRFSGVDVDVEGKQEFFDPAFDGTQTIDYSAEEHNIFGMFLGVEAVFTENASVIFELRFIDELAITLGAGYVF